MVDEEYGLKAVHDGGNRPANLLCDHGDILAARVPGVNLPAMEVVHWMSRLRVKCAMLPPVPLRDS